MKSFKAPGVGPVHSLGLTGVEQDGNADGFIDGNLGEECDVMVKQHTMTLVESILDLIVNATG